ncbi:MAG: GNAT family N-acetyltransferase [Alphaproteobacteria bacterium]
MDAGAGPLVEPIRDASRRLVRELGFMRATLAGTDLPPSAVHALIEIGRHGALPSSALVETLQLDKSSVSRMVRKLVRAGEVAMLADAADRRARPLTLTAKGRASLAGIHRLARHQVEAALHRLPAPARRTVCDGLNAYAGALAACRTGEAPHDATPVTVARGWRPGVIGRSADMHARYYAHAAGFGSFFEAKVAGGMAEFAGRLDRPRNGLWSAVRAGAIVGTVAIDGEDMGPESAHLRWFIVEDGLRGGGIGRRLLATALAFCDRHDFHDTQLWTFRGLDAARHLYEAHGFALAEERTGRQWGTDVVEQRFVRPKPQRAARRPRSARAAGT